MIDDHKFYETDMIMATRQKILEAINDSAYFGPVGEKEKIQHD